MQRFLWVMEPVRGGRLAKLSETEITRLREMRSDESGAAWAFRFLQGLPNVKMILSGMSDMAQMVENVETFRQEKPLTDTERAALLDIAEGMKNSIPCTACRYCCDGCPQGLDIPMLIATYIVPTDNERKSTSAPLTVAHSIKLPLVMLISSPAHCRSGTVNTPANGFLEPWRGFLFSGCRDILNTVQFC